jgi:hypothetical protein
MKLVGHIILIAVLGSMFLSLFHMSTGMDMTGGMTDCPFMERGEVICPMNLADHIGAWKAAFVSVTPTIVTLLVIAGTVAFIASTAPFFFSPKRKPIPIRFNALRVRTYSFSYRPLQELFSSGILHPKLF